MYKKLYFRMPKSKTHIFSIKSTVRIDKPDYTKWVVSVDPDNDFGVCVVEATTDDCKFETIDEDVLIFSKIQPDEWTVHVEAEGLKTWVLKGEISWDEQGSLTVDETAATTVHLPGIKYNFDVDKANRVIVARNKTWF